MCVFISLCVVRIRFYALLFTVGICCLHKGNAHMGGFSFVTAFCLVNVRPLYIVVGVIKLTGIRRLRSRGMIVGLIMMFFQVEYCLAGNSVSCWICESLVVF